MSRTDAPRAAQPLRLWRSAGLRLAALFGFLVLLTMLTTLALVYLQVSTVLHRNLGRQLQQAQQRLALQYAHEGPQATAQAIGHMLQDRRDTDLELVLLTTPDGRFLAGNLAVQALPPLALIGASAHPVALGSQGITAQLLAHRLPDGAMLVLGHDLRELRDIESTLATASLIAGLFALSLALVSTWFFRRELGRSVDALHQTMARIAGGQLHERVPAQAARDDEFARLEQDFNHMLDRIAQLMAGVTHVSDAIAHNLRTPLTRLRLRLQHAHDGAADAAALRAALGSAMHDIDDLSRVLDKLLSIAQAESGTRRAPFTPQSWGEIGADVVELYEDLAEHEGVTLTWECTHPAPPAGRPQPAGRRAGERGGQRHQVRRPGRQRARAVAQRAGRGRRRLQRNLGAGRWPRGAARGSGHTGRALPAPAPRPARPWPGTGQRARGNAAAWRQHAAGAGPARPARGTAPAAAHTLKYQ